MARPTVLSARASSRWCTAALLLLGVARATALFAGLQVPEPLILSKSFSPSSVNVGGVSTLVIGITNFNQVPAQTVSFGDTFPAGLQVAPTPNATVSGCGSPTFAPAAGDTSLSFTNGTVASFCQVTVDVVPTTPGDKVNTAGPASSNLGGSGTATATLGVTAPIPTISEWGAALLAMMLAGAAFLRLRG